MEEFYWRVAGWSDAVMIWRGLKNRDCYDNNQQLAEDTRCQV